MPRRISKEVWLEPHRVRAPAVARIRRGKIDPFLIFKKSKIMGAKHWIVPIFFININDIKMSRV